MTKNKVKNEINSAAVKKYGMDAGADIVGIAASKDFSLAPDGFKPSDNLEGCLSVVVLGAAFPQETLRNKVEYTAMRNAIVSKMTGIAKEIEKRIKANGYNAKAISATGGKSVDGIMHGHISLKHAAELAGLGVIGRNYLLANPEYGNLLWFSAVLTDANLVPDKKMKAKSAVIVINVLKHVPWERWITLPHSGKKHAQRISRLLKESWKYSAIHAVWCVPIGLGHNRKYFPLYPV
jgi:hypothetical protein